MKKRKGLTLVEVVVSVLITAMVTMATFSIFTSSMVSQKKSDKREISGLAIKMVQEALKNYVTSDTSGSLISAPQGTWQFCINFVDVGNQCDTYTGWALQAGNHNITNILQSEPFKTKLCNGSVSNCSFTYTITDSDCGFGWGLNACKQVSFTLNYPD
jgi:type II secretory pathway pseudopilin PulG